MPDVPTPTYITVDQVKAQSRITGLKDGSAGVLDDADIELLIQTAEDQIDAYCGPQEHHPEDSNVDRVFPRVQDYQRTNEIVDRTVPVIPYPIMRACLRQVEWLYTQWWPNSATRQLPTNRPVTSEELGGDGSYSANYGSGGVDFSGASLCSEAKAIIDGRSLRSRWAAIGTTDPDDVPAPL